MSGSIQRARDTIAAIASAPGPARRGVIRISGPACASIVRRLARTASGEPLPPPRRGACFGWLEDGGGLQPLLLLWMPGPHSYTREDVAELHVPGSPPLLALALARVIALGARAAGPGEFTRRAFEHGRIDLSRAEGVLELVEASNDAERRAALALLGGGLERRIEPLREALLAARALAEAALDFSDGDTGAVPLAELCAHVAAARDGIADALCFAVARVEPSARPQVLLHGAPNAGKSTLYNALCGERRALVTPLAGTTRDWLKAEWDLGPLRVELVDTPGLDERASGADLDAQRAAARVRETTTLVLWAIDAASAVGRAAGLEREAAALPRGRPWIGVWTQRDRHGALGEREVELARVCERGALAAGALACGWVAVAAPTRAGLAELAARVAAVLGTQTRTSASPARELAARHRAALDGALIELAAALRALSVDGAWDLAAEHLRGASAALDSISGRATPEDVLDRIFARFCLGK